LIEAAGKFTVNGSDLERDRGFGASDDRSPLLDPRLGDVEDDVSSPKQRSLLAIAGSLLAEISLPKLVFAWTFSILLPALALGLAPLVATAWLLKLSKAAAQLTGLGTAFILPVIVALGWFGWRPLLRTAETNFWSLNALAIQPGYAFCREALRYLSERMLRADADAATRARLRAISAAAAAILLCIVGALIVAAVWPVSRWLGTSADLLHLRGLVLPTLANAIVVVSTYLAAMSLIWGFGDALMEQPSNLEAFDVASSGPTWRVAHLSDIHLVGEQYGFRIESGRRGPRGNGRFAQTLDRIAAIHATNPLDIILISGDMTDAGLAVEWAAFLDALERYPALAQRILILPGNHDLNIVDRLNPARLDLPFSPIKRLRQMRALSAIAAIQGDRVLVIDPDSGKADRTLSQALAPNRRRIAEFADLGGLRRSLGLGRLWDDQYPMVLPPVRPDGLGVVILNSNAETHFSFTNALGLVSVEQTRRLETVLRQFPQAVWIIALHHHLIEYPMSIAKFSERIGTALINGSWFIRTIRPWARRAIVMHGHRHIDWIGTCGLLRIVSAPSPVMGSTDEASTYFLIHTLSAGADGDVRLLSPERVVIAGAKRVN
jgi:Calcineurin-like phosphoesterase